MVWTRLVNSNSPSLYLRVIIMIQEAIVLEWFTTVTTISSYYTINGSAPPLSCGRARPWSIRARLCFFVPTLYLSQNSTSTPLHPTPPSLPDNNNLRLRNSWSSLLHSLYRIQWLSTLLRVYTLLTGPAATRISAPWPHHQRDSCRVYAPPGGFISRVPRSIPPRRPRN